MERLKKRPPKIEFPSSELYHTVIKEKEKVKDKVTGETGEVLAVTRRGVRYY